MGVRAQERKITLV